MNMPSDDVSVATGRDGKTTRLFFLTTRAIAELVVREGFSRRTDLRVSDDACGTWLTSNPSPAATGGHNILLVVDLDLGADRLDQFDWRNTGGTHDEWLIPSDLLKKYVVSVHLDEKFSARTPAEQVAGRHDDDLGEEN